MASFTDSAPQFKEYVSQAPLLEAYVSVGQQKQQAYNQGYQRIQSQIESVAGIDVVRDVDKQYLQSKLNELGSNLRSVAAGDFSNYQLVNNVGGMITSVAKDKNVLNAASNTAKYRKEIEYGDKLRKEGKLSPNREYDFQKSVNEWVNNPNLEASFNGQYKEQVDVNKKVIEVIKNLHPNMSKIDIPYAIKADGTVDTRAIAAAMQRQGIKEVSEGQIRTAINASLDANDIDELYSQGRFAYKGIDERSLSNIISQDYLSTKQRYENTLSQLKKQLLTTNDASEQIGINKSIDYFTSLLGDSSKNIPSQLDQQYESDLSEVASNPDAVRASFYKKNWLDQVSNGFAYKEVTNEIVTNPLMTNKWEELKYNLSVVKEQNEQLYRKAQLSQKDKELKLKEIEVSGKLAGGEDAPYFVRSGDPTLSDINSLENWADYNNSLSQANRSLVADVAERSSSITNKVGEKDILKRIDEYSNGTYTPKNLAEKQKFDTYLRNAVVLNQMKAIYEETEKQATEEYSKELNKPILSVSTQLKDKQPLTVGNLSFSPKEVYDLLKKEKIKITGKEGAVSVTVDDKELSPREKQLKTLIGNRYSGLGYGQVKSTGDRALDSYIDDISKIAKSNSYNEGIISKRVAERLSNLTGSFVTEDSSVPFKDETQKKNFISDISTVINADRLSKSGDINYDPESALSLATKKASEDVNISFRRTGDNNYVVLTDKKDPSNEQVIRVQSDFVYKNPVLGGKYLNQNLDMAQVLLTNKGTTNIFKDYQNAYYKTGNFGGYINGKKTVTLPVAADLTQDGGQTYVTFKINTPTLGLLEYNYEMPINVNDFETKDLPSFTDDKLLALFKTKYPTLSKEDLINQ